MNYFLDVNQLRPKLVDCLKNRHLLPRLTASHEEDISAFQFMDLSKWHFKVAHRGHETHVSTTFNLFLQFMCGDVLFTKCILEGTRYAISDIPNICVVASHLFRLFGRILEFFVYLNLYHKKWMRFFKCEARFLNSAK